MTQFRELKAVSTGITDDGIGPLLTLTGLIAPDLYDNPQLSDGDLTRLRGLPILRQLDFNTTEDPERRQAIRRAVFGSTAPE
jgi:hypothetical protein